MSEEKQSASLRYEAEITSLRLQLDRCRNELVHYTTEATRLTQQLRLKNQYEEEQYKKHLESRVSVVDVCVGGAVFSESRVSVVDVCVEGAVFSKSRVSVMDVCVEGAVFSESRVSIVDVCVGGGRVLGE